MPKWSAYGVVTGTKYIGTFEAETQEEAEEMALNSPRASVSVCYQCSDEVGDSEIAEVVMQLEEE